MTFLTSQQAYLAMFAFLKAEFELSGADEIAILLSGMQLVGDGGPADPAVQEQWNLAVQHALAGEVDAALRFVVAESDAPAWQFGDLRLNKATTIGDQVKLVSIPAWITDNLPLSEQRDILGCVGQTMTITDIDNLGYFWISKSEVHVEGKGATLTGPSFCVPSDCLKRLTS